LAGNYFRRFLLLFQHIVDKDISPKSNGLTLDKKDSESEEDKRATKLSEKDRKIGHRRINEEGEVSYKKIHSNQLIASIQLGIQYSVGVMTKYDDRDLLMQDFMTVEANVFPKNGGHHTPAHTFTDFKFSTFAPLAFR
jgi:1-phosphatidylinositol-4-phosphate 5-kinase